MQFKDTIKVDFVVGRDEVTSKFKELGGVSGNTARQLSTLETGFIKFKEVISDGKIQSNVFSMGKRLTLLSNEGVDLSSTFEKIHSNLRDYPSLLSAFNRGVDSGNEKIKMMNDRLKEMKTRFDMNTLSWIFGGMALKQIGLSLMRFVIPSTQDLVKINNDLSKKVFGLSASFYHLKTSMFSALGNSGLFSSAVSFFVKMFNKVSDVVSQRPFLADILLTVGSLSAALGTLAIGVGLFKQFGHLGLLVSGVSEKAKNLNLDLKKLAGVGIGIAVAFDIFGNKDKPLTKSAFISHLFGGTLSGLLIGGIPGALAGFTLAFVFDFMFHEKDIEKVMSDVGRAVLHYGLRLIPSIWDLFIRGRNFLSKGLFRLTAGQFMDKNSTDKILSGTDRFSSYMSFGGIGKNKSLLDITGTKGFFSSIGNTIESAFFPAEEKVNSFNEKVSIGFQTVQQLNESAKFFSSTFTQLMGSKDNMASVIGKASSFGNEIDINQSKFEKMSKSIDSWKPEDKHVYIYYHHVNLGGGSSYDDSEYEGSVA